MNFQLTSLLEAFSELLPLTNEELGHYWLRYNRDDGLVVILTMSVYTNTVGVIIKKGEMAISSLHLSGCNSVDVSQLDFHYTIVIRGSHTNPMSSCVLQLDGEWILRFEDSPRLP